MREFHGLQQHFSRIRDFTGRNESTSAISSSGRIFCDDLELGGSSDFCGGRFMKD